MRSLAVRVFALLLSLALASAVAAQVPVAVLVLKKSIRVDAFDNRPSGEGAGDAQIAARLADPLSDALLRS